MSRTVIAFVLAFASIVPSRAAFAEPPRPVDITVGAGVAVSSLGDWTRTGQSLRVRVAHPWAPWIDTGLDAQWVRGQAIAALSTRLSLARFYLRGGLGLDSGLHNSMTHGALRPIALVAVGCDVARRGASTIAVEVEGFGGPGDVDAMFPDERVGFSLDAAVRF